MVKRNKTKILLDERATEEWWRTRKIDWVEAYWTPEHCHRGQLMDVLNALEFDSVLELGCGAGANLSNLKDKYIAGIDINVDAIDTAKRMLPHGMFKVGMAEDLDYPDKVIDLILTDACLIYVPPEKIKATVKEMLRVARKYIVCCEWDNDKNIFDGHWVYSYSKLFRDYEIKKTKIENWAGGWAKYGQIIVVEVKDK